MQPLIRHALGRFDACVAHSTRADGDLSPATVPGVVLAERRQRVVPHRWHALHQVHSDRVVVASGEPPATRPIGDALVTTEPHVALAVHSGDCVPIGFVSLGGAVAATHAGWKGLEVGVVESTVRSLHRAGGPAPIIAAIGPHIRPSSYAFGVADLERLAGRFGGDVIATTDTGAPALDLTAAVAAECDRLDIEVAVWSSDCSARDHDRYWSHRARQEPGRIALVAWIEARGD